MLRRLLPLARFALPADDFFFAAPREWVTVGHRKQITLHRKQRVRRRLQSVHVQSCRALDVVETKSKKTKAARRPPQTGLRQYRRTSEARTQRWRDSISSSFPSGKRLFMRSGARSPTWTTFYSRR